VKVIVIYVTGAVPITEAEFDIDATEAAVEIEADSAGLYTDASYHRGSVNSTSTVNSVYSSCLWSVIEN
jgi:hypothetical protein